MRLKTTRLLTSHSCSSRPMLAGCLERGQSNHGRQVKEMTMTACRANNVAVGSPEYVACRKNRDVQRSNAEALRATAVQRDLGEYMLANWLAGTQARRARL